MKLTNQNLEHLVQAHLETIAAQAAAEDPAYREALHNVYTGVTPTLCALCGVTRTTFQLGEVRVCCACQAKLGTSEPWWLRLARWVVRA